MDGRGFSTESCNYPHNTWEHKAPGCVGGTGEGFYMNKSVEECEQLCIEYGTGCVGFEYGVEYGGSGYRARDCNL